MNLLKKRENKKIILNLIKEDEKYRGIKDQSISMQVYKTKNQTLNSFPNVYICHISELLILIC